MQTPRWMVVDVYHHSGQVQRLNRCQDVRNEHQEHVPVGRFRSQRQVGLIGTGNQQQHDWGPRGARQERMLQLAERGIS
jgi:hypothetical protein